MFNIVEFVSNNVGDSNSLPTCVLDHGFGSGLGFYFRNVDPLLQNSRFRQVVAVDWLGMGGSDCPPCQ